MELGLLFAAAAAIGFYQFTGKLIMWLSFLLIAGVVLASGWAWLLIFFTVMAFMYCIGEFNE